MAPRPDEVPDPGVWVRRLEEQCRREAIEIRLRAQVDAEAAAAEAYEATNHLLTRRIERLRELREQLAEASARIERDMVRAATEFKRRSESLRA